MILPSTQNIWPWFYWYLVGSLGEFPLRRQGKFPPIVLVCYKLLVLPSSCSTSAAPKSAWGTAVTKCGMRMLHSADRNTFHQQICTMACKPLSVSISCWCAICLFDVLGIAAVGLLGEWMNTAQHHQTSSPVSPLCMNGHRTNGMEKDKLKAAAASLAMGRWSTTGHLAGTLQNPAYM